LMGGLCRIRSYYPLKGKGLKVAKGPNTNPFFATPEISTPLNHSGKSLPSLILKKVYEYDVQMKQGELLIIANTHK
jgi:alpha-L-fucosidase 2